MSLNRRTFLAATALNSTRILGANDRIRCATIGTGNRYALHRMEAEADTAIDAASAEATAKLERELRAMR